MNRDTVSALTAVTRSPSPAADDDNAPDPRRLALLARLRRRFEVLTEPVDLGPLRLAFTRVADPDRVLDDVAAEEDRLERLRGKRTPGDELHLPYWAELWDSAVGMGRWVVKRGSEYGVRSTGPPTCGTSAHRSGADAALSTPYSVLDLGCGMGLAGTAAAATGHRVLFADLEPAALLFARLNSWPWRDCVRTRKLNWRTDRLRERFDLILGADILYERAQWDHLEPFWRRHLTPAGRVLLGEPGRMTGDLFPDWIASRGWRLTHHEEPVETRPRPIRLFELVRK